MKGNLMKYRLLFSLFVPIWLFCYSGSCAAAEKNALDLDVNASGVDEGANILYSDSSEMALDWSEKVYYGPKDTSSGGTGNFHCAISIQNTGDTNGDLYVKIDFLLPTNTATFRMPSNLTGYYKWFYFDNSGAIPTVGLSATKQKLLTLGGDDRITLFDFVATEAFKYNGPILVTAMLVDTESEALLGIDSEMIFFNTEFKNWIRTHAIP
jgi:hypothetical protein